MTSLQFVERRHGDAAVIDTVVGSGQEGIHAAVAAGAEPLLWGSWELVEIASRLVHGGARAVEARLATRTLKLARDDETASEIVDALNVEDLDLVQQDLSEHDLVVAAITVNVPTVGLVRLAQNGQADVLTNTDHFAVLEAIRPAIRVPEVW
ncbi:hypothetical protein [Pseudolysinimonas sp.]